MPQATDYLAANRSNDRSRTDRLWQAMYRVFTGRSGGVLIEALSFKAVFVVFTACAAVSVPLGLAVRTARPGQTRQAVTEAAKADRISLRHRLRALADLFKEIRPDLRATYGGELLYLDWAPGAGIWNHRGTLAVDARPTRRTTLSGGVHASQAVDPAGLARVGVFRTGRHRALAVTGRGRLEQRRDVS